MTSRERLLKTLRHQEPDRIPYDLGATKVTGIHKVAYIRLREALGLPEWEVVVFDRNQQLARVDEDVLDALEVDMEGVFPNKPFQSGPPDEEDEHYIYYTDEWGMKRRMPKADGKYYDLVDFPLAGVASAEELSRYPWPDPLDPARFVGVREAAEEVRSKGRATVMGGICAGLLEMGLWLRGFENFFADLVSNPDIAGKILDRILETKLRYWDKVLGELGDLIDVTMEGDDLGIQQSLMVSPKIYRDQIKPRQKELFGFIRSKAPVFTFFHTCGSVVDIIPDLIEIGVDILNPIQVSAAGMDTRRLKKEYGKDLVFWGGGVDTQAILPFGSPEAVRAEVKHRIEDLKPGGGFVFNTVHNIQADVPPENILAMWETLQLYGYYK